MKTNVLINPFVTLSAKRVRLLKARTMCSTFSFNSVAVLRNRL